VPAALVEAVAERAAQIVAERTAPPRPWLDVQGAAEYLACPPSRIYALTSKRAIPFEKDGSRTLFRPEALDEYVRNGGAKRP
jgi:excisionase family DNA binding protein